MIQIKIGCFIIFNIMLVTGLFAETPIPEEMAVQDSIGKICWYNLSLFSIEGKGWTNTVNPYDRFPRTAEALVRPPVWQLSRQSAGLCTHFITNAEFIKVRWTVHNKELAMNHFPATGVSGVDLYIKTSDPQWRWAGVGRPDLFPTNECYLVQNMDNTVKKEFLLYLPLYNQLDSLFIGLPKGAFISKTPARPVTEKPVVFYGTSITQGGCASRAGMTHVAQLGRMLNREVINLGFSGNGQMEPELARLLSELDPAIYIIDCLPNLQPKEVSERIVPFVTILRNARPLTPILLVDTPDYSNGFLDKSRQDRMLNSRKNLLSEFNKLISQGVPKIYYINGKPFFGEDGEATVDGTHPTDLGFIRQANVMVPIIKSIIN
ncbi:MAG: hypothetical protein A2293_07875 [Elusimicrobia bacterium RIFOXYB2_FULL_49_7]|nr:MAG: hypothetical protein A2293_07875 [Elusimicrobia bacterium RIFOXYB2_FULL_49_7]